jgi:hypothetical protein
MNDLDLKAAVSQIISLESMADALIDGNEYLKATEFMADAERLEKDLQEQGFVLGDQGTDVLVYHVSAGKARELWLILDTKNGQWRKEQEQVK